MQYCSLKIPEIAPGVKGLLDFYPKFAIVGDSTGIFPRISRLFPSGKIRQIRGKYPVSSLVVDQQARSSRLQDSPAKLSKLALHCRGPSCRPLNIARKTKKKLYGCLSFKTFIQLKTGLGLCRHSVLQVQSALIPHSKF